MAHVDQTRCLSRLAYLSSALSCHALSVSLSLSLSLSLCVSRSLSCSPACTRHGADGQRGEAAAAGTGRLCSMRGRAGAGALGAAPGTKSGAATCTAQTEGLQ